MASTAGAIKVNLHAVYEVLDEIRQVDNVHRLPRHIMDRFNALIESKRLVEFGDLQKRGCDAVMDAEPSKELLALIATIRAIRAADGNQ